MRDTIELLEAIGRDASLRHASAEELTRALGEAQASEALVIAAATGDRERLGIELGQPQCEPPQSTQGPGHEEELEQEEEDAPVPDLSAMSPKR